ncbi:MAG: hypothetical protein SNJ73_09355 [Acetobacteraceae bacterium]
MPATDPGASEAILAGLRGRVEHETPTDDPARVNGRVDRAEAGPRVAGAAVTRILGAGAPADREHIPWRDPAPRAAPLPGLMETLA